MLATHSKFQNNRVALEGGTETNYSVYKVHTFLTTATLTATFAKTVDIFMAGGGGRGGNGGGGGAGAFRAWTGISLPVGTFTVTIGEGGGVLTSNVENGETTTIVQTSGSGFATMTAEGGGHGGASGNNADAGGLVACTGF